MPPVRNQTDLALFSGVPTFDESLLVGRPNVPDVDKVLARIREALERRWLTNNGPLVQEFEQRLADFLDVRHCVTTSNATAGLELVVKSLALSGDVIVPSWTFVADAHALAWTGLNPVFCDVDTATQCLDPERVEAAITPETTGILAVHLWGRGCDVDALAEVADRHGLELIYDAAHAFACRVDGTMIGGFGRAEVFSFHATKMINSFEGGGITTNDAELADLLRRAKNFGFGGEDAVVMEGTNAKMSEASAAMGIVSLDSIDVLLARNHENHDAYGDGIAEIPGVDLSVAVSNEDSNRHYVVAEIDAAAAGLSRDEIVAVLRLENVEARRYFHPGCHRHEPYRTNDPTAGERLPVTEELSERVMVLPTGLAVDPDAATRLCSLIAIAVDRAPEVRRELRTVDEKRLLAFWR